MHCGSYTKRVASKPNSHRTLPRRSDGPGLYLVPLVLLTIGLLVSAACATSPHDAPETLPANTAAPDAASVASENQRPGTDTWRITDPATAGEIAGYAGSTSYDRGATVDLHVSTRNGSTPYSIELYRMGWYGGQGARLLEKIEPLKGEAQGYWTSGEGLRDCATCHVEPDTKLVDANWRTSYKLHLDRTWPTGVYLAKLRDVDGKEAYIPFVVRDDKRAASLLVQLSVNTWQAYNAWGDSSFYGSFSAAHQWVGKTARAYKVSFNRPYDPAEDGLPGNGAGQFFRFEYNAIRWIESRGYDVTYATDVDLHARSDILKRRLGFVSIGHNEYWSWEQRQQVERARDRGVGLAFLGGNDVYWQVRLERAAGGAPNRTLVCYKDRTLDPQAKNHPERTTVLWADDPVRMPQSSLTGTTYGSNATPPQQTWVVNDDSSSLFAGTALTKGDRFPGILGYEYDRLGDEASRPTGLVVVGSSPVTGFLGADQSASVAYRAASGAFVFNAGTVQWSWGLDDFGHEDIGAYADTRLQRLTGNILGALIEPGTAPP
jgi:hypothetical protein